MVQFKPNKLNACLIILFAKGFRLSQASKAWQEIRVPFIAVILALVIGAIVLSIQGINPLNAYASLVQGSLGGTKAFGRTLEKTTPLVLSGLAVAFAFNAGLFNIGAQGQFLFGAMLAAIAGFGISGLPAGIHIALALIAGAVAGGIYAAIQGMLKAYTGAHEVITGIMLNYVAINMTDYLAAGPMQDSSPGNIVARTALILDSSRIPAINGIPLGFLLAAVMAAVIWWFIRRTTIGFEIRTVGINAHAARYAGINVLRILVITMALSGFLAGLGGAVETLGVVHRFQPGFNVGLGFEGITIALLARTHALGVLPAAFLVGIMKAGSSRMQFEAGVAIEIVDVILALMLFFVAADMIIRRLVGGRDAYGKKLALGVGWGR